MCIYKYVHILKSFTYVISFDLKNYLPVQVKEVLIFPFRLREMVSSMTKLK